MLEEPRVAIELTVPGHNPNSGAVVLTKKVNCRLNTGDADATWPCPNSVRSPARLWSGYIFQCFIFPRKILAPGGSRGFHCKDSHGAFVLYWLWIGQVARLQ